MACAWGERGFDTKSASIFSGWQPTVASAFMPHACTWPAFCQKVIFLNFRSFWHSPLVPAPPLWMGLYCFSDVPVLILVYNILTKSSNRLLIIVMCVWWLWWRMSIGFRWICEPCEMVVKVSTALFISVSSLLKRVIFYAPTDPWMPKPNQTRAIF